MESSTVVGGVSFSRAKDPHSVDSYLPETVTDEEHRVGSRNRVHGVRVVFRWHLWEGTDLTEVHDIATEMPPKYHPSSIGRFRPNISVSQVYALPMEHAMES